MRLKNTILGFLILCTVLSCKVQFVPSVDAVIKQEVIQAAQETDALYLQIINSNNKTFSTYAAQYATIESEINAITAQDAARLHGGVITTQMNLLHGVFTRCMTEHKTNNTLNNGQAEVLRNSMAGAWKPVIDAENHYK